MKTRVRLADLSPEERERRREEVAASAAARTAKAKEERERKKKEGAAPKPVAMRALNGEELEVIAKLRERRAKRGRKIQKFELYGLPFISYTRQGDHTICTLLFSNGLACIGVATRHDPDMENHRTGEINALRAACAQRNKLVNLLPAWANPEANTVSLVW